VFDSDDAYIINHDVNTEILPDTPLLIKTPVTSVCDANGVNCDTSDVFFVSGLQEFMANSACSSAGGGGKS
jgi:hypothetical protein